MSDLVSVVSIVCAAIVIVRVICLGPRMRMGLRAWRGQMPRFVVFTVALAGFGSSAFAVAAGLEHSGPALLASVTALMFTDRRRTLK